MSSIVRNDDWLAQQQSSWSDLNQDASGHLQPTSWSGTQGDITTNFPLSLGGDGGTGYAPGQALANSLNTARTDVDAKVTTFQGNSSDLTTGVANVRSADQQTEGDSTSAAASWGNDTSSASATVPLQPTETWPTTTTPPAS